MTKARDLIEELSDLEHRQWAHWTEYMLDNLTPENIERWRRQIGTKYKDLTEKEKDSDRGWALKVMHVMERHNYQQVKCHTCNLIVAKDPVRYTCDACIAEVQASMDMTTVGRSEESKRLEAAIAAATSKLFGRKYPVAHVVLTKELIALKPHVGVLPIVEGRPARVEAPDSYQDKPFELVEGF